MRLDEEALRPAAAAQQDPVGAVRTGLGRAGERLRELAPEQIEADPLPRLVGSPCVEQDLGAGLAEHFESGAAEASADLEDAEGGPVGDVGGAVFEHAGGVADAAAAREGAAGAECAAFLDAAAAACADAPPHGLPGAGWGHLVREPQHDGELPEHLPGEVDQSTHVSRPPRGSATR